MSLRSEQLSPNTFTWLFLIRRSRSNSDAFRALTFVLHALFELTGGIS